jgi:hypothetical protein
MDIHILAAKARKDYPLERNQFLAWFACAEVRFLRLKKLRCPDSRVPLAIAASNPGARVARAWCRHCADQETAGTLVEAAGPGEARLRYCRPCSDARRAASAA